MKVSVLMAFYNQQSFAKTVLESALNQDFDDYEVIAIDDCSSDGTYKVLLDTINARKGYKCKTIKCLRNDCNLGIIGTFNRLVAESSGELLVINEGDDISHSNRLKRLLYYWNIPETIERNVLASMSACDIMDAKMRVVRAKSVRTGYRIEGGFEFWAAGLQHHGAVAAYSRKLWDKFGPMDTGGRYADLIMFFRAAIFGSILKIDESLVNYRCEGGMSTSYRTSLAKSRLSNEQLGRSFSQMLNDLSKCRSTLSAAQYERVKDWLEDRIRRQNLMCTLMGHSFCEKIKCWRAVKALIEKRKSNVLLLVFFLPSPFVEIISWWRGGCGQC